MLISAFPAYYLSRAWVWGKSGKSHFKKEVLPFWIFVFIGLVFSTTMVALGAHLTDTTGERPEPRPVGEAAAQRLERGRRSSSSGSSASS